MSLVARLVEIDRSDRVPLERPGTLRDVSAIPVDTVIDNLSTTGCLLRLQDALPLGALISLGIPGIGMHRAKITRVTAPYYGCSFVVPISGAEVMRALSADTVVDVMFAVTPASPKPAEIEDRPAPKLSFRLRVAIIVGASAMLWAVALGVAVAIIR